MLSLHVGYVLKVVALADQPPDPATLFIIAAVNAVVWVGLFLYLLWRLSRGSRQIDERIDGLEARITADEKPQPKK
jgi:CcmD family protein